MEYNITNFTERLKMLISSSKLFPYEKEWIHQTKHKNKQHMKKVAFDDNQISLLDNQAIFELGNEFSEKENPYYHILEDAPVIRKKGRGTPKTRGSQDKVENKAIRDYSRVIWNGKTFTKEYQKNVRGVRRSVIDRATRFVRNPYNGLRVRYNADSLSYKNIHYHYIENILNSGILDTLASEFGLIKMARTQNTGLLEEYSIQDDAYQSVIDQFNSLNE